MKHYKCRATEVVLCRGFLLSEYAPGLENYHLPDEEIGVFHDKKDLLEKVRFYLSHPEIREEMIAKAYEKALIRFDFYRQVREMLETIKSTMSSQNPADRNSLEQPLFHSRDFRTNQATYRFFWFFNFLKLRKFKFAFEELKLWLKEPKINFVQFVFYFSQVFPSVKGFFDYFKGLFVRRS